eukprot:714891-Rhodomonas_salina.2
MPIPPADLGAIGQPPTSEVIISTLAHLLGLDASGTERVRERFLQLSVNPLEHCDDNLVLVRASEQRAHARPEPPVSLDSDEPRRCLSAIELNAVLRQRRTAFPVHARRLALEVGRSGLAVRVFSAVVVGEAVDAQRLDEVRRVLVGRLPVRLDQDIEVRERVLAAATRFALARDAGAVCVDG